MRGWSRTRSPRATRAPGELGRFVADVGDARAFDRAGDAEVARTFELSVEEADASAQQDWGDVDLHLVEEAGRQVLLGDVGASGDLDVFAAGCVARSLER